ncbi:MAG TPA: tetratricopeptide repeat protein [Planctomycetota bacterium]|jgi:tetratricopeptide (TPR) repeat protein
MSRRWVCVASLVLLCASAWAETEESQLDKVVDWKLLEAFVRLPRNLPKSNSAQIDAATLAAIEKAVSELKAHARAAEAALNKRLFDEKDPQAKIGWAELFARSVPHHIGYRVLLELAPDGSGTLTLSSDRALLADCGKRFARLIGEKEPQFNEDDLRHNPYSKAELVKHLNDNIKFLEARVEQRDGAIDATGALSFKNFDAFSSFADSFDADGYNLVAGSSLTDTPGGTRTFQYKTPAEEDRKQYEKNLLLFHNIAWEFTLDFKGKIARSNAHRTDGNKLIWSFNCYQMLRGETLIQASYDAAGLPQRLAARDEALPLPPAAAPNQPVAVVAQPVLHAKVCRNVPQGPRQRELLEEANQLVVLNGSGSLPRSTNLIYQWDQTYGPSLNLKAESLAKAQVLLVIKEPGEYRFELTVATNGQMSRPAEVKVLVEDVPEKVGPASLPAGTEAGATPTEPPKETRPAATAPAKPEPAPAVAMPKPEPPTPTPPKADPAKAKELYARGSKLLKEYKYAQARATLEEAFRLNPEDKSGSFDLAVALMETGQFGAAETKFQELASDSKDAEAFMYVGHCLVRERKLDEARLWYQRGTRIGKNAVAWEPLWQLGNLALKEKDYKEALSLLGESEKMAAQASVKDHRLMRDLAIALHNSSRDEEALTQLAALQTLGYSPDAQFLEEVTKGSEAARQKAAAVRPVEPVAVPEPAKTEPVAPPPDQALLKPEDPKKDPKKVAHVVAGAIVNTPPVPEPQPTPPAPEKVAPKEPENKTVTPPVEPKKVETPKPPPAEPKQVEGAKPPPVAQPEPKKVETPKPAPAEPKKIEPPKVADQKTAPKPEPAETKNAPPAEPKPAPKKPAPKPAPPKKAPPPVPPDFEQALAAGMRALQEGQKLSATGTEDAKQKASDCFDEAEAMLRGALAQKPEEPRPMAALKELAKHVHTIALVRSGLYQKTKVRGLVVLDAETSIVPADRPMYCVWEQVDGEELGLRAEDLAQKRVCFRIKKPGIYKFQLAVSDGQRGGNPVTVTVEVSE